MYRAYMIISFLQAWMLRTVILGASICVLSCGEYGHASETKPIEEDKLMGSSYISACDKVVESDPYFHDTIYVQTADEFIQGVRSNRVIKLVGRQYLFASTQVISHVENVKIVGEGFTECMSEDAYAAVLVFQHCHNIYLDSFIIGYAESLDHVGTQGILSISHAHSFHISHCTLLGSGGFGLATSDVCKFSFWNSEITQCRGLLFNLENSQQVEFKGAKFHDNNLAISVLGGFSKSTKEASFVDCEFRNNTPKMIGNPAFNFLENWKDFDEKILFKNCTFRNNKGYAWYGDKIRLEDCVIDSADFIGLQEKR